MFSERGQFTKRTLLAAALCVGIAISAHAAPPPAKPTSDSVMLRVKVLAVTPEQPVVVKWRTRGEGLGGDVVSGMLELRRPQAVNLRAGEPPVNELDAMAALPDEFKSDPALLDTVKDDATGTVFLKPGVWSRPNSLKTLPAGFVTFTLEGNKAGSALTNARVVFEFRYNGKVIDQFEEHGEAGPTLGLRIASGDPSTPDWAERNMGLHEYVERRAKMLESLPWAKLPTPKLITFLTDCGGYGTAGYGVRHASKEVLEVEARCLNALGMNSLRGGYGTMLPYMRALPVVGEIFGRGIEVHGQGYPIIPINTDAKTGRILSVPPNGGCPWYPGIADRAKQLAAESLKTQAARNNQHVWALTVDEIGSVFGGAPEGAAHMSVCPHCQAAFREWLKSKGLKPADFDCKTWDQVKNIAYPNAMSWDQMLDERKEQAGAHQEYIGSLPGMSDKSAMKQVELTEQPPIDLEAVAPVQETPIVPAPVRGIERKANVRGTATTTAPATQKAAAPKAQGTEIDLSDEAAAKLADNDEKTLTDPAPTTAPAPAVDLPARRRLLYYSFEFANYSSGHAFRALREACDEHNRAKQAAIDAGDLKNPIVKQAFVYTFALRGNTFLMADHTLDFFDFYREADNAMVYETSNRDPRVWQWDSYLCDVGRSLRLRMNKKFGVYVKPHRGAPVQRTLAAVARGAEMIFAYTYGPDYSKGDSFSGSDYAMTNMSKAARIVGATEDRLVGADLHNPPKVAVVRIRTGTSAEWEDGKWVYAALQHSHVPVDAIDQQMLISEDLSRYSVIYVTGGQILREAALALRKFVEAGGTIYTGAGGMAVDEAGEPIGELQAVMGVSSRKPAEVWCASISRYGAVGQRTFGAFKAPPTGAERVVSSDGKTSFKPQVGREVLSPTGKATVAAKFADGSPALIVNQFGKGRAYLSALYGGLEYSVKVHRGDFDMATDYEEAQRNFVAAPAIERAKPQVDVSVPTVEVVSLVQPKTGKRSLVVMNWTYKPGKGLVPMNDVKITIADGRGVTKVMSAWQSVELPLERKGDAVIVTYPKLEEGDVLVLH